MPKVQDVMRKTPKIHLRPDKAVVWKWRVQWPEVTRPYFVLLGSDSSTVEIHIPSERRDFEDVEADSDSPLENSVKH